jgi:methionyl-tRNA formyltransferase
VAASPLQTLASEHNIETTLVASKMDFKMNEFDESVLRGKFDLGVVVSFGYFSPHRVLECFPQGVINIHPSLLPQYRGATPIYGALRDTLDTTGVSVQEVSPAQIDTGSVFLQEKVAIEPSDTYPELHDRLARKGAALLADTVLPELATLRAKPKLFQPERESSFVGKVTSQHGLLTPESQPAVEIHSQWRALKGNVSVYLEAQNNPAGKRLTLTELTLPFQPLPAASGELPGQLVVCKGSKALQLVCADGQKLEVLRVRVESKKECRAMDFANGYMR